MGTWLVKKSYRATYEGLLQELGRELDTAILEGNAASVNFLTEEIHKLEDHARQGALAHTVVGAEENKELSMGHEVEKEHTETIKWLIQKLSPGPGLTDAISKQLLDEAIDRIAQDHLKELSDYYTRLHKMETEAKS